MSPLQLTIEPVVGEKNNTFSMVAIGGRSAIP